MSILRMILLGAGLTTLVSSTTTAPAMAQSRSRQVDPDPNPFRKTYLQLSLVRNVPEGQTQSHLDPGTPQPSFSYMHDVDSHWMMALGGGLKTFDRPSNTPPPPSQTLAIWTLSHTTYYIVRISHPTYLLVGPKLLYLLPTLAGKPPPQRDHVYDSEIGVGLSAEFLQGMSERWFLSLRIERWRGVKTSRLAGFEYGIGAAVALD